MMVLEGRLGYARALTASGLVALALFTGACGSDDGNGGSDGGGVAEADGGATTGGDTGGSGAGDDGTKSVNTGDDAAQVRTTFNTYVDSLYSGDYKKACAQATASELHAMKVIGKLPCELQFRGVFTANPPKPPKPKVVSVKVDGETALARIDTGSDDPPYRLKMRKVGGAWKINNSLVTDESRRKAQQQGRL